MEHRTGELDRMWIALLRKLRDEWPAGVSKPKRLRHLVERLPYRIVKRLTERFVFAPVLHFHEHRMTARNERHHHGRFDLRTGKFVRVDVSFQVVGPHQ